MNDENEPLILDFERDAPPSEPREIVRKQIKALENIWVLPSDADAEIPEIFLGPTLKARGFSYPLPKLPDDQTGEVVASVNTQRFTWFRVTDE